MARSIDSGEGAASGECEISIPSPAVKGAEGGREGERAEWKLQDECVVSAIRGEIFADSHLAH